VSAAALHARIPVGKTKTPENELKESGFRERKRA
jgi:hypothetical protein